MNYELCITKLFIIHNTRYVIHFSSIDSIPLLAYSSPMLKADHPFSLVIFGASGHLAKIKLFPALYFLALKKRLPADYAIVGFARTPMEDMAFRVLAADAIRRHVLEVNEAVIADLVSHMHYFSGQYDSLQDFNALGEKLNTLETWGSDTVRMAYLSIPPTAFSAVLHNLCGSSVHSAERPFRCIVEKPVGTSTQTYAQIREQMYTCFKPEEVFILDHYLGKEAVRNVYYLRYANPVIERLFKNTLLSHVEITASEDQGLEGRAGYFDTVGTFRDMFQSHLLQIASLLTMRLVGDDSQMKAARLEALRSFYLPPTTDLGQVVMQAQYTAGTVHGLPAAAYTSEEGVAGDSRTPTFAAMKLLTRSPRFEGVPFYLRSGKRLAAKETRITIEFQESITIGKGMSKNRLDIILQGEAGMRFHLQTKMGGSEPKFRPLLMEDPLMCVGDCLVEHSLLILEAINGNQQWFLHPDEVQASWQLVDPLQKYLDDPKTPLALYPAGSKGPKEADDFIGASGFTWF